MEGFNSNSRIDFIPALNQFYSNRKTIFSDNSRDCSSGPYYLLGHITFRYLGFEKHIESKLINNKLLFCYLIQHCENTVKEKIQHFLSKGDLGYQLAKARLKKEYGRSCIIDDVCERQLNTAPLVKPNDPQSLKRYAEQLEKALIALDDINYSGDLIP